MVVGPKGWFSGGDVHLLSPPDEQALGPGPNHLRGHQGGKSMRGQHEQHIGHGQTAQGLPRSVR